MENKDHYREQIFKTPQHYFDELPQRIQKRMQTAEIPVKRRISWQLAMPVVLVAIAISVWFFSREVSSPVSSEQFISEVSDEAIIEYLERSDITTAELYRYMPADEYDEIAPLEELEISDDEALDYYNELEILDI